MKSYFDAYLTKNHIAFIAVSPSHEQFVVRPGSDLRAVQSSGSVFDPPIPDRSRVGSRNNVSSTRGDFIGNSRALRVIYSLCKFGFENILENATNSRDCC